MTVARTLRFVLPLALIGWTTWASPEDARHATVPTQELKRGGYVILVRHGTTPVSGLPREQRKGEPSPLDLARCELQFNLTEQGRDEVRAIGVGVQRLAIPVGRVVSSPYCRALETARLAFGRVDEISLALVRRSYVSIPDAPAPPNWQQRINALRRLLATPPPAGTNIVLVTHNANIRDAVGFEIAAAEAAIFRPDGQGAFTLVARVPPRAWSAEPRP